MKELLSVSNLEHSHLIDCTRQFHLGALCVGTYKWAQSDSNDKTVWQNLAFEDRIRMASQGDFRSSKALLTNQELRSKQQRQQIVDGLY